MAAQRPTELKGALALDNHKQVRTKIAIIQVGMHLEEARRRWGIQEKSPTEVAAALYHLLRPGDRANKLRQLEVSKEMVVKDQGTWVPTRLVGCRMTQTQTQNRFGSAAKAVTKASANMSSTIGGSLEATTRTWILTIKRFKWYGHQASASAL